MPASLQARGWWLAQLAGFMGRSAEGGPEPQLAGFLGRSAVGGPEPQLAGFWGRCAVGDVGGVVGAQWCGGADLVCRGPVCAVWGQPRKTLQVPLAAGAKPVHRGMSRKLGSAGHGRWHGAGRPGLVSVCSLLGPLCAPNLPPSSLSCSPRIFIGRTQPQPGTAKAISLRPSDYYFFPASTHRIGTTPRATSPGLKWVRTATPE